jgi:hypothetical protein
MPLHLDTSNPGLAEEQARMRARHSPAPTGEPSPPAPPSQPGKENLSIPDIAEKMAVSHDTASRLFRNHPEAFSVSPDPARCRRASVRVPRWVVDEFIKSRKRANCRSFTDRKAVEKESA